MALGVASTAVGLVGNTAAEATAALGVAKATQETDDASVEVSDDVSDKGSMPLEPLDTHGYFVLSPYNMASSADQT